MEKDEAVFDTRPVDADAEANSGPIVRHLEVDDKNDDAAAKFLAQVAARPDADQLLAPATDEEIKKILRKVDPIVVTLCLFAFLMGSLDKVAISQAAAVMNFRTDLGLVGQQYSWISSSIYFGAIAAIIPSLMVMQKVPANYYVATQVLIWGIITTAQCGAKNFGAEMAIRIILGFFESVISVAFGIIVSTWWTREEQPMRTAIMFTTCSSIINGIISYASVSYTGHAIKQWQLLFLLIGSITMLWSLLMFAFLPASPMTARWLTMRQRVIATRRMGTNHTGVLNTTFKYKQALEALLDPKTWLVFVINVLINIPNGGLSTFNSIIVASLGFTAKQTTLLNMPTGVFSQIAAIFFSWIARRTGQQTYSAMASCIPPFLGTILLYVLPRSNQGASLAALYLAYFYWAPYIIVMALVYANTGGHTKKLIVYAISYIGYCVGNLIAPQTFQATDAPKYTTGVTTMMVCWAITLVLLFVYRFYMVYLNKRKARQLTEYEAVARPDDLLEEWQDQTDMQNPKFVYAF
ncbi:hypothetical protein JCM24511_08879 [Saitozyma sp. JCM 24511]|nr:hypothetical protein JCM24511_08879 [Saitozyma sp. JCM 24511]